MVLADFIALAPILILAVASLIVMIVTACVRHHATVAGATVFGLGAALGSLPLAISAVPRSITALLIVDHYALFYLGLILAAGLCVAVMSYGYLARLDDQREEYYLLLLLATLGGTVLTAAAHFASFFLGLELLSVSLYGLIAYLRDSRQSLEAGIKYLILSAASSAFLLFGMALIYGETGAMAFAELAQAVSKAPESPAWLVGLAMVLTGVGFKLAIVPFHMWAPDVYQGAPAPVTAFVATLSKGAVVALLLRYVLQVNALQSSLWQILWLIAVLSMFVGNLLALLEENVKRILAYSSIAHLGYLLVAFLAGGALATEAVAVYLVAYFITTLGAFGVVTVLSRPGQEHDQLHDYAGLFWHRPWLSACMILMLLSLAGIPLTAGFIGKFYIIAAGLDSGLWLLVILFVINSVIGLFYYLRIVITMTLDHPETTAGSVSQKSGTVWTQDLTLAALTLLLLWFGIYPAPLIRMIQLLASPS
jgi:NADH-quinone oxidoreductase subunit N